LEQYVPGLSVSVAALTGPNGSTVLEPCRQRISDDGRLRYLGGELPLAHGLAQRARNLAERAIGALPATVGYVGLDMILGREPDGSGDVVIELNPRLTTSYVGLRACAKTNLAEAMWLVADGEVRPVEFDARSIEFDPSGNVSFMR
jgi:predicted ATP-grasp superfamily ATP-dependent carboligase